MFKFCDKSAVAVGAFNTHIVHPGWLRTVGVFGEEDAEPEVQIDFQQPGFRLVTDTLGKWVVRPDRLSVETDRLELDVGLLVGEVIKALPWTPVIAVGTNFRFEGQAFSKKCLDLLAMLAACKVAGYDMKQNTWHIGFSKPQSKTVANVQVSALGEKKIVNCNFHTDTKGLNSDAIVALLGNESSSLSDAKQIISTAFSLEVE